MFIQSDSGEAGFIDRFAEAVGGSPYSAADTMARTLRAVKRSGKFIGVLAAGDFLVHTLETGATCVAATARNDKTRELELIVAVGDTQGPIPDLGIRTTSLPDAARATHVTDALGTLRAALLGETVEIAFGSGVLLDPDLSQ